MNPEPIFSGYDCRLIQIGLDRRWCISQDNCVLSLYFSLSRYWLCELPTSVMMDYWRRLVWRSKWPLESHPGLTHKQRHTQNTPRTHTHTTPPSTTLALPLYLCYFFQVSHYSSASHSHWILPILSHYHFISSPLYVCFYGFCPAGLTGCWLEMKATSIHGTFGMLKPCCHFRHTPIQSKDTFRLKNVSMGTIQTLNARFYNSWSQMFTRI